MQLPAHTIHVAVFNCDLPPAQVVPVRGPFNKIFQEFLERGAKNIARHPEFARPVKVEISAWDVFKGEYPTSLDGVDALLLTGSTASAYDDLPWIRELMKYLNDVFKSHPSVKLFGSCFGHQIVSQALFSEHGVQVKKSPLGWEIGVHQIEVSPSFASCFPRQFPPLSTSSSSSASKQLELQFVHADEVVVPKESLPEACIEVGTTTQCRSQGIYWPGRVLTLQGHAEFDRYINGECMKTIGSAQWTKEATEKALQMVDQNDDSDLAGEFFIEFLLQNTTY